MASNFDITVIPIKQGVDLGMGKAAKARFERDQRVFREGERAERAAILAYIKGGDVTVFDDDLTPLVEAVEQGAHIAARDEPAGPGDTPLTSPFVTRARDFAIKAHGDQKYGDAPYFHHLDAVADVLEAFGWKHELDVASAYLHDVLEDTDTTEAELRNLFPPTIVDPVVAVTDEPGPYGNRKERKAATYPKIRAGGTRAIRLKLADRIANVEASKVSSPRLFKMYQKEQYAFSAHLRRTGYLSPMWIHLDRILKGGDKP